MGIFLLRGFCDQPMRELVYVFGHTPIIAQSLAHFEAMKKQSSPLPDNGVI